MYKKKMPVLFLVMVLVLASCQNPFARSNHSLNFSVNIELAPSLYDPQGSRFLTPDTESIRITLYFNDGVAFTGSKTLTAQDRSRGEISFGVNDMPAGSGYTLVAQGLNGDDIVASGWTSFTLEPNSDNLIEVGLLPNSEIIRPLESDFGFTDTINEDDLYKIYRAKVRGGTFRVDTTDPFPMSFYDAYGRNIPDSRYYFDGESQLIFENMKAGDYYIVVNNPQSQAGSPYIRVSDDGSAPFPSIILDTSAFGFANPSSRPTVVGLLGAPLPLNFYGEGWSVSFAEMIVKTSNAQGIVVFEDADFVPGKYDEYAVFVMDDLRQAYDSGAFNFTIDDLSPTNYGIQGMFEGGIERLGFYVNGQVPGNPRNYETDFSKLLSIDPMQLDNTGFYYLDFIDGITVTYGDSVRLSPNGLLPYTETEPNNVPDNADTLQLGTEKVDRIVGQLDAGDTDTFVFTAPADGDYDIVLASFFDYPGSILGGPNNVDINIWEINADPDSEEPVFYGDASFEPFEYTLSMGAGDRVYFEIEHGGNDTEYSVFIVPTGMPN